MASSHGLRLRPEWLGPRRELVIDLMNIFAPREENVAWIMLTRAFQQRFWLVWVLGTLGCYVVSFLLTMSSGWTTVQIPFFMLTLMVAYFYFASTATGFLRRVCKDGSAENLFTAPLDNAQYTRAFQGLFSFLTLTSTVLFAAGMLTIWCELCREGLILDSDFFKGFGLGYAFCYTFVRVYFWSLLNRGWFRALPLICIAAFLLYYFCGVFAYIPRSVFNEETYLWLFPTGMFLLSVALKRHCCQHYLRSACTKLFP